MVFAETFRSSRENRNFVNTAFNRSFHAFSVWNEARVKNARSLGDFCEKRSGIGHLWDPLW